MLKTTMCAAAFALASGAVCAQQAQRESAVVVTASGYAQTVDATLADVTVIDRAAIDASGAADLRDLLRLQAGIDIPRAGGPGTQTNVFLRGTNSNHVLVLIDGVRAASMNTGAFAWGQLPLDSIERIEIVRGPRAAVWGSDAIGGVIQIFTRKLGGPALALQYGSHADASGSAGFGHWRDGEGFSINVGMRHVRGFSAQNRAGYGYDPDDDGMRGRNFSARGAIDAGSQVLSGSAFFNDTTVEFDQGVSHNIEQTAGVQLAGTVRHGWQHRLSLTTAREDLSTPVYATAFHSRRRGLDWRNRFDLNATQQLVAGVSLMFERGRSVDTVAEDNLYAGTRTTRALYVGWYGSAGRLDWELAGRHDHNDRFGHADTGSAALGLRLTEATRLVASWGQGFRAPNLNEQFSPGYGGYYAGNPDLQPERSHTSEVAWTWTPDPDARFKLAAYRTRINHLISFTSGALMQAQNIASARIDGVEATAHWNAKPWSLVANATWQAPRDLTTGAALLRRPRRKANVIVSRHFGTRFNAGLELVGIGTRLDLGGPLPGYSLLNVRATWQIDAANSVHLRAANVLDRDYTELRGFNTPGRSFWLSWDWRPQ